MTNNKKERKKDTVRKRSESGGHEDRTIEKLHLLVFIDVLLFVVLTCCVGVFG